MISYISVSAAVKWSPSQTWIVEALTVFRRETTKRETIMGIKLEGPELVTNSGERVKYVPHDHNRGISRRLGCRDVIIHPSTSKINGITLRMTVKNSIVMWNAVMIRK